MEEHLQSCMLQVPSVSRDLDVDSEHSARSETDVIHELDLGAVCQVPIRSLLPADSPRLTGEDADHVRRLEASEDQLPPILVHRPTMRVIDGMHRLRVAQQRNHEFIGVRFFEGSEQDAFVLAVRSNVVHGLPLTLNDREAAAERIITAYPSWSDRMIAIVAGLSAGTIRMLRRRIGAADGSDDGGRVGRDGRRRPLDPTAGRLAASRFVSEHPDASLREIARQAGISLATARDVRDRVRRGDDPLPPVQRTGGRAVEAVASDQDRPRSSQRDGASRPEPSLTRERMRRGHLGGTHTAGTGRRAETARRSVQESGPELASLLHGLARDPSLRFTESGRLVLRWLSLRVTDLGDWVDVASAVPPHCTYIVADLARRCADEWMAFAEQIEKQMELMA
jgi:hypothetical protein